MMKFLLFAFFLFAVFVLALAISTSKNSVQPKPTDTAFSVANGFTTALFAKDLDHPRDLQFSPGGTLLVSTPPNGKILALLDEDKDGFAETKKEILTKLNNPHGLAFYQGKLFVAEETKVVRYIWDEKALSAKLDKVLFELPVGGRHTTRTLAFKADGTMFVSIGSTCDVCFEQNPWHAAVIISNSEGSTPRVFAKGLRNAVFIKINAKTNELWGTEMGRDFLGDNAPPDEINIIKEGKDYGWPICYGNKIHDNKFDKNQYLLDPCLTSEAPLYALAAHSAPLGLSFIDSAIFPEDWQGDLLVALHGSWNSTKLVGYKIVRLKIEDNKVLTEEDFISNFVDEEKILGRPVDLEFEASGHLYISDDKSGAIYLVRKEGLPR
jgi:glucose/arabinose dehydrogenase